MRMHQQENASERAYRDLRRAILEGQLPTDRKVTEEGLAEQFNISRTPIRDAIKRLILEGLLERRPGHGLWCAVPNAQEVREIFELRLRLESYAAKTAAIRATAEQIAALQQSAKNLDELVRQRPVSDDVIARIDAENARFHGLVIAAAHSPRLNLLVQSTVDISLISRTFRRFTPEQRERSAYHHREIAAAIAVRSPEWAERMMEIHILTAAETFDLTYTTPARDE